ncbi:MAG: hypothetical protein DHS20C15_24060 [Planctomycetota bacterium]|nr:MAG: hypothetical protein DHS20C15_24060 [Planctomycetota bacterium]
MLLGLALLSLTGCGDAPSGTLGLGPAPSPPPWETGFEREWFYPAHLAKSGSDARWAHLAAYIGRPAPELQLDQWRFGKRRLADLRGKVVLLDFWATWCTDCLATVPHTNALRERLAGESFEVLGICAPKGAEDYAESLQDSGLAIPTGVDTHGDMERAFGVPRWPYFILLDADGRIAATGLEPEFVDAAVDHLLAVERARGALR